MTEPTTRAELRAARRARVDSVLNPAFRQWAYGLTAAAFAAAVGLGWLPPQTATVIPPLLMALFYVDKTGKPRP